MAMTDDLPRTLRREREARERAGLTSSPTPGLAASPAAYVPETTLPSGVVVSGTTVTDIRIPFFRLVRFGFKLVFASVPALILLTGLLWLMGHLLMTFFPWLVKLQILIRVP